MSVDSSNNINFELLTECIDGTYIINDDGSIDVNGDVNLSNKDLTKIPFKFRNVSGDFHCYNNQLTSLEGSPNIVGGIFGCTNNKLTSLEYSPTTVGSDFYCYRNQLTSLEYAPKMVGGDFRCNRNHLTTLEGAPKMVGGDFRCNDNPEISYSELFKIVDRVKGNIFYLCCGTSEDKDKIRRDRDVKTVLKDDELGNLDV